MVPNGPTTWANLKLPLLATSTITTNHIPQPPTVFEQDSFLLTFMAMSSLFSPSLAPSNPAKDHELLFSDDPKFALHGEILMLVIVLFFVIIFLAFVFLFYTKCRYTHPKHRDTELVMSKSHPVCTPKGQIEDRYGFNLYAGPIWEVVLVLLQVALLFSIFDLMPSKNIKTVSHSRF